jgi:hypothetical protein
MSDSIGQDHIGLLKDSIDCPAIGVEKELVGIVEETIIGCPWSMDTESVSMSGVYVGNVAVMNETVHLGEPEPCLMSEVIEEAQFNTLGVFGIDGEVSAGTIPRGTLWVR